jgi:hypothetical protein
MTHDPQHHMMPDASGLVAAAETLAELYDRLLAERLPASAGGVLDGLFDSIVGIEQLLHGDVGPRARGVLGSLDSV